MLDMSWGELMVIGAVALIVIGPKDLPKALRTLGNMTSKIRRMAAEFQGQFSEAMREAELDDVKRQIQGMNDSVGALNTGFDPIHTVRNELKSAIEGPVGSSDTAKGESATPAPPSEPVHPSAGGEPALSLPLPPAPPAFDPAEAVVAAPAERDEPQGGLAEKKA